MKCWKTGGKLWPQIFFSSMLNTILFCGLPQQIFWRVRENLQHLFLCSDKQNESHIRMIGHPREGNITYKGPQFAAEDFFRLAHEWEFWHATTSPLTTKRTGWSEGLFKQQNECAYISVTKEDGYTKCVFIIT